MTERDDILDDDCVSVPRAAKWFTMRELAARWKVSYDSIRREVIDGHIPSLKIRSEHRIALKTIELIEAKAMGGEIAVMRRRVKRAAAFAGAGKDHYPDC